MTVAEFIENNKVPSDITIKLFNSYVGEYEAVGSPYSEEVRGFGYCRVKGIKRSDESRFFSDVITLFI